MTRTLLITGAGGFLARHIAARFRASGWRLVGLGRSDRDRAAEAYDAFQLDDLSDVTRTLSLLERYTPHAAIHLAAPSSVPESMRRPLDDFQAQVLPAARLLEAIRLAGNGTSLVLLSSAAVYGNPRTLPVAEDAPLAPISPYGFHKLQQELLCDEYRALYATRVVKARVFSTFGEGLRRLAVWDLTRRAFAGDRTVLGTGEEMRDYLYAADVASALEMIVDRAAFDGEAINIASGTGTTIAQLAAAVQRLAGLEGEPHFTGALAAGTPGRWIADVSRLASLGWTPHWSFDDGLQRTVDWIRRHA
ncbi:MAG: NAD-dependent epimerase/dehydratase family protein [Acidobacteria bacterium]|nr:NAD-dependent epimerase/dehydratase family protein [Acidobacteriota bacterium]MBV9477492.1 NAD-dependent epimerase/dehydratase family protein [Acidobacteriota bacterium]